MNYLNFEQTKEVIKKVTKEYYDWKQLTSFMRNRMDVPIGQEHNVYAESLEQHQELLRSLKPLDVYLLAGFVSKARLRNSPLRKFLTPEYENKFKLDVRIQGALDFAPFLPKKLYMLDCEFTGLREDKDDILQVAMIALTLKDQQYRPDRELNVYVKNSGQPQDGFQREHLVEVFRKCNESNVTYEDLAESIADFLGDDIGDAIPCGDCVPKDISLLKSKGIIHDSYYEKGKPIAGTFHYEFFEINPLKLLARQKSGLKEDLPGIDHANAHDALVDCRNQTIELNYYIHTLLADAPARTLQTSVRASEEVDRLPPDLRPAMEAGPLPAHVDANRMLLESKYEALSVHTFAEFQALLDRVLLRYKITEEYRESVAGLMNEIRVASGGAPL